MFPAGEWHVKGFGWQRTIGRSEERLGAGAQSGSEVRRDALSAQDAASASPGSPRELTDQLEG